MKTLGQYARMAAAACALMSVCMGSHAQSAGRFVGTITAVNGSSLTVKTDAGDEKQIQVEQDAVLKRLEPGQKDLNAAPTIAVTDLAIGDRVLVKVDPAGTGTTMQASQIIAMKQSDLAQKQQKEREDWQKRGIGGLVKSVDAGANTIVVSTGAGPTAKTVTVKTTPSTQLLRYAKGSVRFADAKPAPMDAINAGDQLRARGDKSPDGMQLTADEVVSGTFRNVSGMITSIDTASNTIELKDLATKKPVTVHIVQDTQMRRIPDRMAQFLAMRLKGQTFPVGAGQRTGSGAVQAPAAGAGQGSRGAGGQGWNGGAGPAGGAAAGEPQAMLSRLPAIPIADLKKGEAVMIVATDGSTDVNAITLLAGVEPLLEAPAATNLLSNWSMGGGGGADAAGPQ